MAHIKTILSKNKELIVFDEIEELMNSAISEWKRLADEAVKERGQFYVVLSGGKTPIPFYQRLAERKPAHAEDNNLIFHKPFEYYTTFSQRTPCYCYRQSRNLIINYLMPIKNT